MYKAIYAGRRVRIPAKDLLWMKWKDEGMEGCEIIVILRIIVHSAFGSDNADLADELKRMCRKVHMRRGGCECVGRSITAGRGE